MVDDYDTGDPLDLLRKVIKEVPDKTDKTGIVDEFMDQIVHLDGFIPHYFIDSADAADFFKFSYSRSIVERYVEYVEDASRRISTIKTIQ